MSVLEGAPRPGGRPVVARPRLDHTAVGVAGVFGFCVLAVIEGWPAVPASVWELLQLAGLLAALAVVWARRQALVAAPLVLTVLAGYGTLTLFSTLLTETGEPASLAWQKLFRGLLVGLTAYLLASTPRQFRAMGWGALLGAATVAVLSVTGTLGLGLVDPDNGRLAGPVGDPNFFAQFQAVGFALAARWAASPSGAQARAVALAAAGACGYAIVVSESRGGLLAATVVMLLLVSRLSRVGRRRLIFATAVAAVVVLNTPTGERLVRAPDSVSATLDERRAEDTAVAGRLSENLAALRMFADHPLFGIGYGEYPNRYLDYSLEIAIDQRAEERQAHNLHLEVLAETGFVGFAAWIGVIVVTLGGLRRSGGKERGVDASVADGWRLAFLAFLLTSVFLHDSFPNLQWFLVGGGLAVREWLPVAKSRPPTMAPGLMAGVP